MLRPVLAQGEFQHHRRAPCPDLAAVIEHFWYVSWDLRGLPAQRQETLPHPNVQMVIERGAARIYGVHAGRFVKQLEGQDFAFGIKFKPGGFYPFYGKPVSTLEDQSVEISAFFGTEGAILVDKVLAASDADEMISLAEDFLRAHLPPVDGNVERVSKLLADIAGQPSMCSVDEVAAHAGLDKRTLQRLFSKYVGIGPKWVINRYRLHEAIARVQLGEKINWSGLAQELGYFDQAHFIRDFRQMIGQTPQEYDDTIKTKGVIP